jgi:hypothetical protein
VLDAFDGFQRIRQGYDFAGIAFCRDYLKAVIVVKMYMLGRQDTLLVIMLNIGKFIYEFADMMVKNKRKNYK